jgi:hypothetical protein
MALWRSPVRGRLGPPSGLVAQRESSRLAPGRWRFESALVHHWAVAQRYECSRLIHGRRWVRLPPAQPTQRRGAAGARPVHIREVAGSNPAVATKCGSGGTRQTHWSQTPVALTGRAGSSPAIRTKSGPGESRQTHQVEKGRPETPGHEGSTPSARTSAAVA